MALNRHQRQVLTLLAAVLLIGALWWVQAQGEETQSSGDQDSSQQQSSRAEGSDDGGDAGNDTGSDTDPDSGLPLVALADLPPEAADMLSLIDADGPYPHREDDGVFGNFEGILPDEERGYYREYTVDTPGVDHRGARRIVAGSGGELYWTDDHYSSFSRIVR